MKKAEGGDPPAKPVPRFGAKSPTPSSSPVNSPPSLRRVKPAAGTPIGSPISTPTAGEEKRLFPLKSLQEDNLISKEQTNGIHTPIVNSEISKENTIPTTKQASNEVTQETQELQKIRSLENEISRLSVSREQQQQEIKRLNSDLEKAKGIISSHELANDKLNQQITTLQSQIGTLEGENKKILRDFEEFKLSTLEHLRLNDTTKNNQYIEISSTVPSAVHIDSPIIPPSTSNHLDSTSRFSTPSKYSSYNNQDAINDNASTVRQQNQTPPPMTSSLLYSDSPSSAKPNPNINSTSNNFGKYVSYSNSKKLPIPSAHQSKNTLQDLQGLLSDMIRTAQEQRSNVEVLLSNIEVTLTTSTPNSSLLTERPMTPEETVYFRGEKKNLERELARLGGVISELMGQKSRCDSKLERAKQKIEEGENAKLRPSSSSGSSSASTPPPYTSPPPSYLEVRDLSPSHSFDPVSSVPSVSSLSKISVSPSNKSFSSSSYSPTHIPTTSYSPTRNISPYFYYGNNKDKIELPPPPDRYSPSSHKLTSDHIQKFTPQFVPDAQKLKSFPSNTTLPQTPEKSQPVTNNIKDEISSRPNFEWNYYFSTRS